MNETGYSENVELDNPDGIAADPSGLMGQP